MIKRKIVRVRKRDIISHSYNKKSAIKIAEDISESASDAGFDIRVVKVSPIKRKNGFKYNIIRVKRKDNG